MTRPGKKAAVQWGSTGLPSETDADACLVSCHSIPPDTPPVNVSPGIQALLDQALERWTWHTEHAEKCRRDIRFYQAALGYHQEQARRAVAIQLALLERQACDGN